jgi:hypothetical protein
MTNERRRPLAAFTLVAACLTAAAPALSQPGSQSQSAPAQAVARAPAGADDRLSIPVTPEQEADEVAGRERLNREQAEFAARQRAENRAANEASQREYEQAVRQREELIARQQTEYEAALAAVEAERQRLLQEHEAAMARWRADVAACTAGDRKRCARPG